MPLLFAGLIRYLVMAAMNTAVAASAFVILDKGFEWIAQKLMSDEKMTREEAEDSIASEVLAVGGAIGANAALLKSRLPMRIADRIQKPLKQSTLSPQGRATGGKVVVPAKLGILKALFSKSPWVIFGTSVLTSIPWWPSLVQNFLDQGTFNPAGANRAMSAIGLGGLFQWPTAPKTLQPGTYTTGEFLELFDQLTTGGAVGINNTFEQETQMWDKDALSALINTIIGTGIIKGAKADKTYVKKELGKYIISRPPGGAGVSFPPSATGAGVAVLPTRTAAQIQIYTGVVTSGTLGVPAEFIARQDDMIEDVDELKAAAKNNLAAFVQSLPGKFYYELAIVNTVKSRGGFTQKGSPVRIISSYNKNGTPRYKTIYHKFAVMQLGVLDENGRSVKLGKINLGPVNAVSFQPTTTQLQDVAKLITPELFTSDINAVSSIITSSPVSVLSATPQNPNPPTQTSAPAQTSAGVSPTPAISAPAPAVAVLAPGTASPVPAPAPLPVPVPQLTTRQLAIKAATTLTEFYAALGSTLPPLYMRAKYYASAGLGAESTYVGSAEQNNRFLAWLKTSNGV